VSKEARFYRKRKQAFQQYEDHAKPSPLVESSCPSCGSHEVSVFFQINRVPVHSVLLMATREMALNYPQGDIALGFCESCGFISNMAFDPGVHEYSSMYEETQGFSPTFNSFHRTLADYMISRYGLYDKSIVEIGCGKGEFLTLLCELGNNRGIGFDPAYVSDRNTNPAKERITFIKDFYSREYAQYEGDFFCCKMTLEHIQNTREFVRMVHDCVIKQAGTVVFFQVPDVMRILRDVAFWDIYYEHCSYFSMGSLARLFHKSGFDVVDVWKDFEDQYVMIEARPRKGRPTILPDQADDIEELKGDVACFSENVQRNLRFWKEYLGKNTQHGKRTVLWGGGSKAVGFLTTLDIHNGIEYVVDINPYKHGTYLAGTGQGIVAPDFLREYKPDVVIVMNPVYRDEVTKDLQRMGLSPEVITV